MPDKRYVKGCGKGCIRCWYNRLNHGSKLKKKMFLIKKKFKGTNMLLALRKKMMVNIFISY